MPKKKDSESGQVENIVSNFTIAEESEMKRLLKKRGWESNNYWGDDKWTSPYTKIDYEFGHALQIEDLINC
jgi:hypothetical protein